MLRRATDNGDGDGELHFTRIHCRLDIKYPDTAQTKQQRLYNPQNAIPTYQNQLKITGKAANFW